MEAALNIEMICATALRPFEDNPRTISPEKRAQLRDSLTAHGVFKPLLIWGENDLVIGGNQRLSVLSEMIAEGVPPGGVEDGKIPCIRFAGDEKAARAVALRDNASDGEWSESLPDYLADLREDYGDDWQAALVGFDPSEIDEMLAGFEPEPAPEGGKDPLAASALPEEPTPSLEPSPAPASTPSSPSDGTNAAPAPTPAAADEYVGERFTKIGIGNIRGKIGNDLYGRWLVLFNEVSRDVGSTELSVVFRTMIERLEAHAKCAPPAPAEPAPKKRRSKG